MLNMNTEKFIEKAIKKHGNKYDYSKVKYDGTYQKVCIICKEHGEFWQTPNNHLNGSGCPKCTKYRNRYTTEEWILKAREIHGDKYDYSKVEYKNSKTKVCIICKEHGEFWITPDNHLQGEGCPICRYIKSSSSLRKNIDNVISDFKHIHGDKYDYSKVEYKNRKTKVCIICKEHGEFWQTPDNHMKGKGCPYCAQSKLELSTKQYLIEHSILFEHQKSFEWLRYKHPMRLDFYLPEYNAAIECQGIQHFKPFIFFGGEDGLIYNTDKDKAKLDQCLQNGVKLFYYSNEKYNNLFGKTVYHNLDKLFSKIKEQCSNDTFNKF